MFDWAFFFEALMLVCFGVAWPLSIIRMLRVKSSAGKSFYFLGVVLIGYLSGICFKLIGHRNAVLGLYILNATMVAIDLVLTAWYRRPRT
jgi:hypothetical protein